MSEVLCYKCHSQKAVYKIRLQLVCKDCFVKNTEHSFRCTLKTSILPRNGEKILICVSGGMKSTCLLHLMDSCNNPEKTSKMMKFLPEILFVDTSSFLPMRSEDINEYLNWVQETYKYPLHRVRLEDFQENLALPQDPEKRKGVLFIETHKLILKFADHLNIKKVVTGENASRIASLVLSGMCKGAGVSVNTFSGELLEFEGTKLAKPMRELLDKEVGIYHFLHRLPVLHQKFSEDFEKPSIDFLIEGFLSTLQSKFPSTTHTLLRTASKLVPVKMTEKCELCLGPKDFPLCDLEKFVIQDPRYCYSCQHLCS
jgi:tRNA(Ile)-lysidine synthase TilS/MesJ